jgi:molybdate transport system ATP-binding protein
LDAPRKAEVLPYIELLRRDFSIPILYVSHSVDEITRLADHIVILAEGKIVAAGDLVSVMSSPAHAPLFGRHEAGTILDCRVEGHDIHYQLSTLSFPDGVLRVPAIDLAIGASVRVRLRAREIALSLHPLQDVSMTNQLAGHVIELIERQGPYIDIVISLGHTSIRALITRESRERLRLIPGMPVWALIKAVALDRKSVAA